MLIKIIISIFFVLCISFYFIYFNDKNKQIIPLKEELPTINTSKINNTLPTKTRKIVKIQYMDKNMTDIINSTNIDKKTLYIQYRKQEYKKYKQEIEYMLQKEEKLKHTNNLKLEKINTRNKNNLKYEKEYKIHNMQQKQIKEMSDYKEMQQKQNIHYEMKKLIKDNSL